MSLKQLEMLNIGQAPVNDLSPLMKMPLKVYGGPFVPWRDSRILRSIKTLETVNGKGRKEFVAWADWEDRVRAMKAEDQVKAVSAKMKELNPGFDGKFKYPHRWIEKNQVVRINAESEVIVDLSPLRALAHLKDLTIIPPIGKKSKLPNLDPLRGMKLERLNVANSQVEDLVPIRGMALTYLNVSGAPVADLSPLAAMPLSELLIAGTNVADLKPLRGMPLTQLQAHGTKISDLTPLDGSKLTTLTIGNTTVTDLSPLQTIPLEVFSGPFVPERDAAILRQIKTLKTINGKPAAEVLK